MRVIFLLLLAALAAACGKKGPPLAPLYLIPGPVTELSAGRVEDAVRLRFVLPSKNLNGPGIDLERVEIFAVTVAPGDPVPPNQLLMTKPFLAGAIEVQPPAVEGGPPPDETDARPSAGEMATFVEELTPEIARPSGWKPRETAKPPPAAAQPIPTDPDTGLPYLPTQPKPGLAGLDFTAARHPSRIYVIRGVTRAGRPGQPSTRVLVPLGGVPDAPGGVIVKNLENALAIEWTPEPATVGPKLPTYNIYRADAPGQPLNRAPLETPAYEHAGAPLGEEICFRVRRVDLTGTVTVESAPSTPACVTPADTFAPAAPKGLAAVATPGAVQLIWNPSSEADLAGYVVLRAEAPDETLQPLTPAPIRDTVFRDTSVRPGARYVYAIVAVDTAKPPNPSAPSERAEAIGR